MAFKREGDDGSWLNSLQNRRVAELFAEDIPEGEAHLMKNGRFACMVCSHRPIFDTVLMLAQHRDGKKHLASKEIQEAEKEDLRQLRLKRQHEELIKAGQISTTLIEKKSSGGHSNTQRLLGAAPYNPRHRRVKNGRRNMIDIAGEEIPTEQPTETAEASTDRISSYHSSVPHYQHNRTQNHPKSLKSVSHSSPHKATVPRKHHNPVNPLTGKKLYASSSVREGASVPAGREPQTLSEHVRLQNAAVREEEILTSFRPYQRKKIPDLKTSERIDTSALVPNCDAKKTSTTSQSSSQQSSSEQPKPIFIQEFRSGYKKDRFGEWVRDEDAEFDSDDDSS